MKNLKTHAPMTANEKFIAWLQLTRFDKPVGTELLLHPTLWALFLAYAGQKSLPSIQHIVIFALGAILMRAAGCAINDFADRKVDGQVKRTHTRPLADGRLSPKTAVLTFIGLSLLAACLLFFLPQAVFYWSLGAVLLAFIYPFMKRFTNIPQLVLAAAFGWAIPMAFVAVQGAPDLWTWVLFIAYMCWTVAYDTEYAMCDRDDDLKIGVKSTAILFGRYDVTIIIGLNLIFTVLMSVSFWHYFDDLPKWLCIMTFMPVLVMFFRQYQLIANRERLACFTAFKENVWVGRYILTMTVIFCLIYFR